MYTPEDIDLSIADSNPVRVMDVFLHLCIAMLYVRQSCCQILKFTFSQNWEGYKPYPWMNNTKKGKCSKICECNVCQHAFKLKEQCVETAVVETAIPLEWHLCRIIYHTPRVVILDPVGNEKGRFSFNSVPELYAETLHVRSNFVLNCTGHASLLPEVHHRAY